MNEVKAVLIPSKDEHEGSPFNLLTVNIEWVCPVCGKPRGEIYNNWSYDGSCRLLVSSWNNPCGHIDKYGSVREEAQINRLNLDLYPVTFNGLDLESRMRVLIHFDERVIYELMLQQDLTEFEFHGMIYLRDDLQKTAYAKSLKGSQDSLDTYVQKNWQKLHDELYVK